MTAEFITTALAPTDVPPGVIAVVDVRGTRIAVANVGGTYYAFDDTCTHAQCSLAEARTSAGSSRSSGPVAIVDIARLRDEHVDLRSLDAGDRHGAVAPVRA
jgi:hypothetical protein